MLYATLGKHFSSEKYQNLRAFIVDTVSCIDWRELSGCYSVLKSGCLSEEAVSTAWYNSATNLIGYSVHKEVGFQFHCDGRPDFFINEKRMFLLEFMVSSKGDTTVASRQAEHLHRLDPVYGKYSTIKR